MEFLFGFFGAIFGIVLLAGGFAAGWKVRKTYAEHVEEVVAKELSDAEKQQLIDEQEAFSALQNYSVAQAYGIQGDKE